MRVKTTKKWREKKTGKNGEKRGNEIIGKNGKVGKWGKTDWNGEKRENEEKMGKNGLAHMVPKGTGTDPKPFYMNFYDSLGTF